MVNVHGAGVGVAAEIAPETYLGSRFSEVRAQLRADPYAVLPPGRSAILSMFERGRNLLLSDSFARIDRDEDMVPPRPKLLHSVGIGMFGRWRITEDTGYTGCFRGGTDYLIVARCSTLLSHTDRGSRRGFGFAGKIFPTLDPDALVKTANFITIDVLGGTLANRFTDVKLTNEPPLGVNVGLLHYAFVVLNVIFCFKRADTTPSYRPLYELTEQGLRPGETPKGPKWLQISADPACGACDAVDFRDELRLSNYKDGRLSFTISVATEKSPAGVPLWRRIGAIDLTECVCSASADQRLRFRHLPNRGRS